MKEQDLDSSKNPYLKEKEKYNYTKQVNWEMAIGLQKVDNLNPSSYLINLSNEYIKGDLTIEEVEKNLKNYYIEHEQKKQINKHEKECDFVSLRIVELLNKDNFELSIDYLKYIHKYLFQDIYDFAGNCNEWTQEANNTGYRVFRGGFYNYSGSYSPASDRDYYYPDYDDDSFISTRPTLYIM